MTICRGQRAKQRSEQKTVQKIVDFLRYFTVHFSRAPINSLTSDGFLFLVMVVQLFRAFWAEAWEMRMNVTFCLFSLRLA